MKAVYKLISAVLIFTTISHSCNAQQETKEKHNKSRVDGFIVTNKGDTIHGKVRVTNRWNYLAYEFQDEVSFENKNGEIKEYTPDQLKCFGYVSEGEAGMETTIMESTKNPVDTEKNAFCKLYINGPCKKYGYFVSSEGLSSGGFGKPIVPKFSRVEDYFISEGFSSDGFGKPMAPTFSRVEHYYIQVEGGNLVLISVIGFRKAMQKAFAMCPAILAKLKSGQINFDNWDQAVIAYNKGYCK